jgi:hypothetical protein
MSGLDKARNVSSEPVIAPALQSEDLYAQTVIADNRLTRLIAENKDSCPAYFTEACDFLK